MLEGGIRMEIRVKFKANIPENYEAVNTEHILLWLDGNLTLGGAPSGNPLSGIPLHPQEIELDSPEAARPTRLCTQLSQHLWKVKNIDYQFPGIGVPVNVASQQTKIEASTIAMDLRVIVTYICEGCGYGKVEVLR